MSIGLDFMLANAIIGKHNARNRYVAARFGQVALVDQKTPGMDPARLAAIEAKNAQLEAIYDSAINNEARYKEMEEYAKILIERENARRRASIAMGFLYG